MDRSARAAEVAAGMHAEHLSELEAALASAKTTAARAEERAQHLQARLDQEGALRAQAQADLAAERAAREGVVALLTRERETTGTLNQRLEQAIAGAVQREKVPDPATYVLDMTNRDPNGRTRLVVLRPQKGE